MRSLGGLSLAALALSSTLASAQPAPPSWLERRSDYEERLRTAEIREVQDVGEGVTNPRKVTLEDGEGVFHAIYKPLKRGRHQGYWESYQAEVAAYELDKMIGLDMVPPTVVRRVEGDLGSLQLWVEGCDTYKNLESKVPRTPWFSWQISRMKMFDNLIYNEDRNSGNFLLDESWNIILIDHSRAFLDRKDLLDGKNKLPVAYDRKLVKRLEALTQDEVKAAFDDMLMGGQVEAILVRRDKILEHQRKLVEERGQGRVMFN